MNKKIKNWKQFNEGLISKISKIPSNINNFLKIIKLLKNWKEKYKPSEYDNVISEVFKLINDYHLEKDKLSPSFSLPNEQLEEEFIKKFFKAAKKNNFQILSKPSKKENYTTFNLKKI